jgi:hypothetical protein
MEFVWWKHYRTEVGRVRRGRAAAWVLHRMQCVPTHTETYYPLWRCCFCLKSVFFIRCGRAVSRPSWMVWRVERSRAAPGRLLVLLRGNRPQIARRRPTNWDQRTAANNALGPHHYHLAMSYFCWGGFATTRSTNIVFFFNFYYEMAIGFCWQ